jgi:hypothetical protein
MWDPTKKICVKAGTDESQSGNKGGTTGIMTTNPEAKTDDAVGTRGGAAPTVATPGGLESGAPHGCTALTASARGLRDCGAAGAEKSNVGTRVGTIKRAAADVAGRLSGTDSPIVPNFHLRVPDDLALEGSTPSPPTAPDGSAAPAVNILGGTSRRTPC